MKIVEVKHYGPKILAHQLRGITMLKDPEEKIYKDVYISIERLNTNCLVPPQNYVLNYELENKLELKYELERHGYNLFELNGYIVFKLDGENIERTLLPPIVEESIEADGTVIPIICDGMHRCYLAKVERKNIDVIYVRGVPKQYPYYAYPVLGGWNKVEKINTIEPGFIKKFHRIQDNKKLYRNFDSVFSNCSKPRGSGK